MEVHDVLYIDVPRFESLASQRMFGLTQAKTVSEVVSKGNSALLERAAKGIQEERGHHTGMAREVRELDNGFREFLEAIKEDVQEITCNIGDSRIMCEAALLNGQFVRAQGPFFYNDLTWLKEFSGVWEKGQEALNKSTPTTKEEQASFKATKESLKNTWPVVDFAFGKSIECGVALGQPDDGLLVKAVLDPKHLRLDSASFIGMYGTKTRCNFTILGTVARVGWQQGVELIDKLSITTDEGLQAFKKTIEATQEMAVNIRRSASGGAEHSVYVMPLAVYRSSLLKTEK